MLDKFIEAFKRPVENIFEQEARLKITLSEPFFKDRMFASYDLSVIIGLSGETIQGISVLSMNKEVALKTIAQITEQESVTDLDELGRDCLGELTNIIVGNSTINLYNMGIKCSSTPPTLVVGNEVTLTLKNVSQVGVIPFELPFGKGELNVAVSEPKR